MSIPVDGWQSGINSPVEVGSLSHYSLKNLTKHLKIHSWEAYFLLKHDPGSSGDILISGDVFPKVLYISGVWDVFFHQLVSNEISGLPLTQAVKQLVGSMGRRGRRVIFYPHENHQTSTLHVGKYTSPMDSMEEEEYL